MNRCALVLLCLVASACAGEDRQPGPPEGEGIAASPSDPDDPDPVPDLSCFEVAKCIERGLNCWSDDADTNETARHAFEFCEEDGSADDSCLEELCE